MREQQGDWWCPTCKQALSGQRVTSAERCDTCGTPVCVAGTDQEAERTWLREENGTLRATLADREARIAALEGAAREVTSVASGRGEYWERAMRRLDSLLPNLPAPPSPTAWVCVCERHGWDVVKWKNGGGYNNLGDGENRHRERIWFSPACVGLRQEVLPLFR